MNILLFDIGNTRITIGAYRGDDLVAAWHVSTRVDGTADEYAVLLRALMREKQAADIPFTGGAIVSSVPPLVSTITEVCDRYLHFQPLVVGSTLKTGMTIHTDSPSEVGGDRICNAVAAKKFHSVPAIVVDFSTATVFDALNARGDYVGTVIAPGVTTSAEALFRAAAQLPRIELAPPTSGRAIGTNTTAAVKAGLIYGYVALVEGMVSRLKKELGEAARVIGTGELVHLIAPETKTIQVVDEELTLKGLKEIWGMNV